MSERLFDLLVSTVIPVILFAVSFFCLFHYFTGDDE